MDRSVPLHNYAPLGLKRDEAAAYIGVGPTKFDEMVAETEMPAPRIIGRRRVWDREEIKLAFKELPKIDEEENDNPWDEELAS